jgi:hypothetical protein
MLDKLVEFAPRIISAARQSVLGVVSLIVLVLAVAAVILFKDEASVTARIIILGLLILSFVVVLLVVIWSGYHVTSAPAGTAAATARAPVSVPAPGKATYRVVGALIIGGVGLLVLVVWLAAEALFDEEAARRMSHPGASHIAGWTTIYEESGVLQGRGGTLSVYPKEIVPGFQVFVHIPRERVVKSEWVADGGGNPFLAVTVRPPY